MLLWLLWTMVLLAMLLFKQVVLRRSPRLSRLVLLLRWVLGLLMILLPQRRLRLSLVCLLQVMLGRDRRRLLQWFQA